MSISALALSGQKIAYCDIPLHERRGPQLSASFETHHMGPPFLQSMYLYLHVFQLHSCVVLSLPTSSTCPETCGYPISVLFRDDFLCLFDS